MIFIDDLDRVPPATAVASMDVLSGYSSKIDATAETFQISCQPVALDINNSDVMNFRELAQKLEDCYNDAPGRES